jgi:hypothetical protein
MGRAPMPNSKHRRKGKPRPRWKVNNPIPPQPIAGPHDDWRQDAELVARLHKMYGGNDWTDDQVEAATDEIDRESDALLMARLRKMYGGNDWCDWTEEQIDAAIVEIAYEKVEAAIQRRAAEHMEEWGASWAAAAADSSTR